MKISKYLELHDKVSKRFNSLPFEKRSEICIYNEAQRLLDFEQLKSLLKRNYDRQLREINDWENNIYKHIEETLRKEEKDEDK